MTGYEPIAYSQEWAGVIVCSGMGLYSGGGFIVRGGLGNCILRSGLIFRGWAYSQGWVG